MVEEKINEDQALASGNLDVDRIQKISIEGPEEKIVEIDDKTVISNLLTNDLRIFNGGRIDDSDIEYDLFIHYYGAIHRYTFGDDYIKTRSGNYKVLSDKNELLSDIAILYEEN